VVEGEDGGDFCEEESGGRGLVFRFGEVYAQAGVFEGGVTLDVYVNGIRERIIARYDEQMERRGGILVKRGSDDEFWELYARNFVA
jgi:hypothetical protein